MTTDLPTRPQHIGISAHGPIATVTPSADLRRQDAPLLASILYPMAEQRDGRLIIDLSLTQYIDTSALAVIITAWLDAEDGERHGKVCVVGVSRITASRLRMFGLSDRLPTFDTAAQAEQWMTSTDEVRL